VPLFAALEDRGIRYVVVGGVATVLHGYARMTADLDLIVDLDPDSARRAIEVLTAMGFTPTLPLPALQFADPAVREGWIKDKQMQVFSLVDSRNPLLVVDLFVHHPIDFEELYSRSVSKLLGKTEVRVASIPDLIVLKEIADRPQDRDDIEKLREIMAAGRE
jgi:predicted nucleotidyltransferase